MSVSVFGTFTCLISCKTRARLRSFVGVTTLFKLSDLANDSRIVHFEKEGSTAISISENEKYRWLSFNDAVQTVVCLKAPWKPILPHLSAMLLVLRYIPKPDRILELGLGGGSLQRFMRHHFPQCTITSIENNPQVISLFQQWFNDLNQKHHIICGDAQQEIGNHNEQQLIFIDLFSKSGSPDFVSSIDFYMDCLTALQTNGALVINLITQYQTQIDVTCDLLKQLNLNIRVFSIPGFQNRIIMASREELPVIDYDAQLNHMAREYDLNLNAVVAMN